MALRIFIVGGGRFGTHLATRLCEVGCEVVIADNNGLATGRIVALWRVVRTAANPR
jgi:Trk K+ transport system NAD-binding subunit